MDSSFYKKSGLITLKIARDLFTMDIGEKLPTIAEYTEQFSVSRGTVQDAINLLLNNGCMELSKNGSKGSFLTSLSPERLCKYANWESLTGTMPVPLNTYLTSLTTGICHAMTGCTIPFSFAFITGSVKRMEALNKLTYDFIVVSKSTALSYLKEFPHIEGALTLRDCSYSAPYRVFFSDLLCKEVKDGMTVGIDHNCTDQAALTHSLCRDKEVKFVEIPYIGLGDAISNASVDCAIYREEKFLIERGIHSAPINIAQYSSENAQTPVILTNMNNYGIKKLIQKYLLPKEVCEVQKKVMSGDMAVRFY